MRIDPRLPVVLGALVVAGSLYGEPPPNPVIHGGQPVVSPDGDRIAFLSNRAGADDLYVIGAKGSGEKRLTQTAESEIAPQWLAGGKELAFSIQTDDTSRLYAIDPKGKGKREIGDYSGRAPVLSPDGTKVVFMGGTWTATKLTVAAPDGKQPVEITDGTSIAWNHHWSPDGKRIAFTGRKEARGELAVFVMNADGSDPRQVSSVPADEGGAQWPVWSPDGTKLAVQVNSRTEKGSAFIWVIDVATGQGRKLGTHDRKCLDETPSWFPDGKRIAFQSNRTGTMEVWVMNADGTGARQVTGR
jgi:Tol biopolymer transport system component